MANLNNEFLADPLDFARRYAIDAGGGAALEPHVARTWAKSKDAAGDELFQVRGARRIIGGEIMHPDENRQAQDAVHRLIGRAEFKRRRAGQAGSFPCYWLPWVTDGVIRTTLRPQRNQAEGPDPDVFFTAGLNGCMIFVEGERDQPTVYHANAGSTHGPADERNSPRDLFGADQEGLARACIQAKVDNMTARYRAMSQAAPKLARNADPAAPRPALGASAAALSQVHYQTNPEGPPEDQKDALIAALGAQSTTGRADEISIADAVGTVFGVRDRTGLWTFYYQKIAKVRRVRFTKRSAWAQHVRRKDEWKPHVQPAEWVVMEAKQFWPNVGGGAAQFQINRR
ncbi:MAG: hypothetical protein PVH00_06230 [Gemmatimonadota bacterium]|jgi:hypothetical protein